MSSSLLGLRFISLMYFSSSNIISSLALSLASSSVSFLALTGRKNYPRVLFLGWRTLEERSLKRGVGISTPVEDVGA